MAHEVDHVDAPVVMALPRSAQAPAPCCTWGCTLATPEPPVSAEVPLTVTVPLTTAADAGAVTAPVGATASTLSASDRGDSALPAVSTEKYRTVALVETVNGAVYAVEVVVGVLPSVV